MSRHYENVARQARNNGPDRAHQIAQLRAFRSEKLTEAKAEIAAAVRATLTKNFTPEFPKQVDAELADLLAGVEAAFDETYPIPQ